jgi:hypothetical protein
MNEKKNKTQTRHGPPRFGSVRFTPQLTALQLNHA